MFTNIAYFCVACDEEIYPELRYYTDGKCLYCGHESAHSATLMDVYTKHYYELPRETWWKFWQKPQRVYSTEILR